MYFPVKVMPRGLIRPVAKGTGSTVPAWMSTRRISPSMTFSAPDGPWIETKNFPSKPLVMLSGRGPTAMVMTCACATAPDSASTNPIVIPNTNLTTRFPLVM